MATSRKSAGKRREAGIGHSPTTRRSAAAPAAAKRRPLLVIDGDSFAHRAYHGLPKTIRRRGDKAAGAIVGFANFLLRLYETERPRSVREQCEPEPVVVGQAVPEPAGGAARGASAG